MNARSCADHAASSTRAHPVPFALFPFFPLGTYIDSYKYMQSWVGGHARGTKTQTHTALVMQDNSLKTLRSLDLY